MKGSIDKIINLLYTLQLTKSISYYDLKFPANAQIYLNELRKLVDAEALKPDNLLEMFGFDFKLADVIDGVKEVSKDGQ